MMKIRPPLSLALAVVILMAPGAKGKKKAEPDRGILEKMDAVPCGAKQKGLSGLGSFLASLGITDAHATEKLCPHYPVRPYNKHYRLPPINMTQPLILPSDPHLFLNLT